MSHQGNTNRNKRHKNNQNQRKKEEIPVKSETTQQKEQSNQNSNGATVNNSNNRKSNKENAIINSNGNAVNQDNNDGNDSASNVGNGTNVSNDKIEEKAENVGNKKESESKNKKNERKVPVDVRVAVIGNVDSGKSTMIGVLTSGDLDDGRGKARSRILKHNHERSNGRTSCSSQHILGFNNKKKPVHQPVSISATPKQKTQAWTTVFQSSKNIVTFIDLAGHEKYLKTTISGLTGCFPDYSFIVVGANMGISKMTREHIQVAIALGIPLFVVITKIDISPEKILKHTVKTLAKLLRSPNCNNKMPLIIRKKKEVKLLFEKDCYLERICPIFCVSAVKGDNIDILNSFLCRLKPREPWKHHISELNQRNELTSKAAAAASAENKENDENKDSSNISGLEGESQYGELEIDETFAVRGVGIVVSGTVTAGRICSNQRMFLGPFSDSTFKEIIIRSVHMKRCNVSYARAGETCSISFRFNKRKEIVDRVMIRKGMVCISDSTKDGTKLNISHLLTPVWAFTATILVLHHPTTINEGYQPVVHCGNIRQTATIMKMSKHRLRSGDSALIDMKFLCHPEFMHVNRAIIIREGNTKCIGKVIQLHHDSNYTPSLSNFEDLRKKLKLFGMSDGSLPGTINSSSSSSSTITGQNKTLSNEKEEKTASGVSNGATNGTTNGSVASAVSGTTNKATNKGTSEIKTDDSTNKLGATMESAATVDNSSNNNKPQTKQSGKQQKTQQTKQQTKQQQKSHGSNEKDRGKEKGKEKGKKRDNNKKHKEKGNQKN